MQWAGPALLHRVAVEGYTLQVTFRERHEEDEESSPSCMYLGEEHSK